MRVDHRCTSVAWAGALLLGSVLVLSWAQGVREASGQSIPRPPRGPAGTRESRDGGPIVITRGGTYRGKWQGRDARTPVVIVRTSEPVVIENSEISGRSHLIATDCRHANITVRDTAGHGLNPDVAGVSVHAASEGARFSIP